MICLHQNYLTMSNQSICYYTELDPYSGSISQNPTDLPQLVWDLKFACLFYDAVLVSGSNILEHRLTLPAFELLAPFVRIGKLWTSTNYNSGQPIDFLMKRAEEFFGAKANAGTRKKRYSEINEIKDRWENIIPTQWLVQRNVHAQVQNGISNFSQYLFEKLKNHRSQSVHHLLDSMERMRADKIFDRHVVLAQLGSLRETLYFSDVSEIAIMLQREYLEGSKHHGESGSLIFPSKFAQRLKQSDFQKMPDFDYWTFTNAKERLNKMGIDLNQLIALPVSDLFEIAQSKEWLSFRQFLLQPENDNEQQKEIAAILARSQHFKEKLTTLLSGNYVKNTQIYSPVPTIIPANWLLSGQTLLGTVSVSTDYREQQSSKFILNLHNRKIYKTTSPSQQFGLEKPQVNLLALLAITGKLGVHIEHIKQLDIELNLLEHDNLTWQSQANQATELDKALDRARLDKINVLKTRTNKKLERIGLKVCVEKGKGRWYLCERDSGVSIILYLAGTAWETPEKKAEKYVPKDLSKQSRILWDYLWECSPGFVSAEAIASILGKEKKPSKKQVSDAIYKLNKALTTTNEKWIVSRNHQGEYCLVPRA